MVIDTLDNFEKYEGINPLFKEVTAFLKANDLNTLEPGKHPIKGTDLFVNITTANGRMPEDAVLETHRRMIDIQIPLSADETYGYTPCRRLPDAEYNEEKDITKMPGVAADSYVTCNPGMFAIFFPEEGHAPCIGEGDSRKAIFKVLA